jgi:16S rRNA (cytosine967-C5)-methyltransferase
MPAPARVAAFRALLAISSSGSDLGDALMRSRDPLNDPRDRALATDLVTGTLRWRGALDYQLQQRSSKALAKLDAAVRESLRLGAYQLLHLERVPHSAVVNDSVALVKASGVASASGFVNAILRRLARERDTLRWPARNGNLAYHLAVVHSHPEWLVARWLQRYGPETTESWLRFNNDPPSLTLATNRLRGSRESLAGRLRAEGIDTAPTQVAPHGLLVTRGRALAAPSFADGAFVVQDEASQLIPELVDAHSGQTVLDACAAPGGKTLAVAAQCAPDGRVVATDVRQRRVGLLRETLARCRVPHAHVVLISTHDALPFRRNVFARVLVDAPCSGLGTVRRDPDIRWKRRPDDFTGLAEAQVTLLDRIAPVVAPGGRLVYSTCSSEAEENEQVVAAFLGTHPDFALVPLAALDSQPARIVALSTAEGYLRTDPTHGLEAFFGAVLEKRR